MSAESDRLLAEAKEDFDKHNDPETAAAAAQQLQDVRAHAAQAAAAWGNGNGARQ